MLKIFCTNVLKHNNEIKKTFLIQVSEVTIFKFHGTIDLGSSKAMQNLDSFNLNKQP